MKKTLIAFKTFIKEDFNLKSYTLLLLFLSILIAFNYTVDFEDTYLDAHKNKIVGWLGFFLFYISVYLVSILLMKNNEKVKAALKNPKFYLFLIAGFAFLTFEINYTFFDAKFLSKFSDHSYFNQKISFQINESLFFIVELILLGLLLGRNKFKNYGLFNFSKKLRIYIIFLLMMIPLIYIASTQPDFLDAYPRLKMKYFNAAEYLNYFLAYEPFYLLNFIRIEWVFRGFMILAFVEFLDKRAIIAIATVYCIFHFGKPMGECISSFFGGYILGMMVYYTKSIWGGVIIHMGIAFLMDFFALLAH